MKSVNKTILAIVIITGLCLILVVRMLSQPEPDYEETDIKSTRPQLDLQAQMSWPMFRGGQSLLGTAAGSLPDSLQLLWKFKTGAEIKSSPVINDGLVFIGSADANVYAVDLENGNKVWSYQTGDAIEATPCVIEGGVFIGSSDNFLYALDANSGQLKFKYETNGQILGAANWTRSSDGQSIWILVGSYDNILYCLDSKNGQLIWKYETANYINGSPAVGQGIVAFGGCDAMIHIVSLTDGSEIKQIDSSSYIAASAAIFEGRIYIGNYDNVFISVDISSGKILWKYTEAESPFFSSPAVNRDVVVLGCRDKRVHCIGRDDGKPLWTFQTLGEVDSSPVICGDKVIVGSEDGRLYMVRLSNGKRVWSYEIGQQGNGYCRQQ
ncbi:MAG: outer membrane protein assembly factor BamB family protein [Planctomycetota bacterium]|jgi:outer membrane protein assembly factor BamB